MDTIFALATPQGKSGVAVIRVSGPEAFEVASGLCALPEPQSFALRFLKDGAGRVLDQALVLAFAEGRSFTGEATVEFQVHGSVAVIRAVLDRLSELNARLAEPGEFSRRALESGQMDLAQVEALADLIEAETQVQHRQAVVGLSGSVAALVDHWRADLLHAAALLEAVIDFADEEVPEDVTPDVLELIQRVRTGIEAELKGFSAAERVRSGFEVAIVGPPNVGKSTLLNALAGREAALTSEFAGTTRDVIEVRMDLGGVPVTLLDTAGVRQGADPLEQMGIDHGVARAKSADMRVFVGPGLEGMEAGPEDLVVTGKGDLYPDAPFAVSGKTGLGIERLLADIGARIAERVETAGVIAHKRQRDSLLRGYYDLEAAIGLLQGDAEVYELAAEEIRSAMRSLESLLGRIDVEMVLGEIFSRFCMGK